MIALPQEFCNRMKTQLGGDYAAYLRAMEQRPLRTLRVNTLKITPEAFVRLADFPLTPVESLPDCFVFPADLAIGAHPLHLAGLCYVQEPSAQLPVRLLDVAPGMTVLDLCAAPGGKSGQIAAALDGRGLLISNEPVAARAGVLQFNLERLGVKNAAITSLYPESLCPRLAGCCDRVLVDAPCSGEGMFRKEPEAVADWSSAHVAACAKRQLGILLSASQTVRPGGRLMYSTCTFSPEENEGVIEAFLRACPSFSLVSTRRLYPHAFPGEGQFLALLTQEGNTPCATSPSGKTAANQNSDFARPRRKPSGAHGHLPANASAAPAWDAFCASYLTAPILGRVESLPDGRVFLLPDADTRVLDGFKLLRCGVLAGEVHGARFVPDHALFLALGAECFRQTVPLADAALGAYLAGETVACDPTLSGWCAVTAQGFCIGFGKAVAGTLKNHLPKGLRHAVRQKNGPLD